jgi:hypothetical protein
MHTKINLLNNYQRNLHILKVLRRKTKRYHEKHKVGDMKKTKQRASLIQMSWVLDANKITATKKIEKI